MGMDLRLVTAHSKKELEQDNFWSIMAENKINDKYEKPAEVYYARKFWDLYKNLSFTNDYECGEYIPLRKEQVEEMLRVACQYRDYWDSFNSVPDLCELLDRWSDLTEHNLTVFFECDW